MAYIDFYTGEVCVKIAYAGFHWAGFWPGLCQLAERLDGCPRPHTLRLAHGLEQWTWRPPGRTCRGRPVRVEVLGIVQDGREAETAMRLMLQNVSGIIHLPRIITGCLRDMLCYQDLLHRAAAFWQHDLTRMPQITQYNVRWCSHCGETTIDGALREALLNPWGADSMNSVPLMGRGVSDAFAACLERALARAEHTLGPPRLAAPVAVDPAAMSRRAFALLDAAGRSDWLSPDDRQWLLDRAEPLAGIPWHPGG